MENLLNFSERLDHIRWGNPYMLGIKLIDDQHKKILQFARNVTKYCPKNEEEEYAYFKEVVLQVVEYIKIHFATEEGVMLATQFPGYDEHKKAHENFILTVIKSIKDYEAGNKQVIVNFSNYVRKWILSHITLLDVKYIEHFKRTNIRRSDTNLLSLRQEELFCGIEVQF